VVKNSIIRLGFIGTGTIGSSLALQLSRRGYPVVAVSSRHQTSAGKIAGEIAGCSLAGSNQAVADAADLVFITTPDDIIAAVAAQTAWREGQMVVHCSGADSTVILEPAQKQGALTGVIHPLQTFASLRQAIENMPGSTFALEAEAPLLKILQAMATALDGHWIKLKAEDKVLYHTAAVMVCNYLVTLVKLATDLWLKFGIPADEATAALLPLMRGTIHNLETIGIPECLTGPIARGDSGTIRKHLRALQEAAPDMLATYKELGVKTVPIALAKGKIDEQQAIELAAILE